MLLAGSELTKEDRESQLYDGFEHFKMLSGENINEYYVRFHKLVNDMRNIRMKMPNIQLNSKFVNNMSPEWDRFVTVVKLNKGLEETSHEQLYAYLKQNEKHATQDRLIIERITLTTNDQLAFVSIVQPYTQSSLVQSHHYPPSSAPFQSPHVQSLPYPQFAESSQLDSGYTQADEILDTLTKQVTLLVQSFRATLSLKQTTNFEPILTPETKQMVGSWFRMFRGDKIIIRGTLLRKMVQLAMGEHKLELGMPMQNSDYFKNKMLLMQAQGNGAVLNDEELLFLTREQTNNFDADVDDHPFRDLALNDDNIFQADECDAFDSDDDDEPTNQSIFMANLLSVGPTNQQASPSNASILSEVDDLENAIDLCDDNQDEHEIHNEVQQKNIIDSTRDHMGNSNVTPYEQYLSVNDVSVVPSCASSISNYAYVLNDNDAYVPHDPLVTELNIYKEQVVIYEQRVKFELTLREQKMDEQMSILIRDRNQKEENLEKELHSLKLQLNSTIQNNKIIEENLTALKQGFKQKETKFLTDFSNLKNLKDKLKIKLYLQDQSIQTVHMMLKPTKLYDQDAETDIALQEFNRVGTSFAFDRYRQGQLIPLCLDVRVLKEIFFIAPKTHRECRTKKQWVSCLRTPQLENCCGGLIASKYTSFTCYVLNYVIVDELPFFLFE
nr:hypothetical protein [Tanacetum cinerariifolium]